MDRFLIKDAFGSEARIRRRRIFWSDCEMIRRLFEIQGYKRKCGKTEDAQYSENQNQLRKCCIWNFVLKTDIIANKKPSYRSK